jgi:hypothetical protein
MKIEAKSFVTNLLAVPITIKKEELGLSKQQFIQNRAIARKKAYEDAREKKWEDMIEYEKKNPVKESRVQIETRIKSKILANFLKKFPNAPTSDLANFFSVSDHTITRWKRGDVEVLDGTPNNYNNELYQDKEIIVDEEALVQEENKLEDFKEPEENQEEQ